MTGPVPVRFIDVALEGAFWCERLETVLTRTIPSQHVQLEKHGILESLKLPNPPPPLRVPRNEWGFTQQIFWDSDVGKWIEAASYALSHRRDDDIEAKIEAIIDDLERAQAPDGYLNCWYLGREPENRFTNLRDNHELYNLGHMIEGGIAYFLATGRRRLLDILERYVALVRETFGPRPGQRRGYCGHQEIELALLRLYRLNGNRAHLDLASYFINERGATPPHYFDAEARARGVDPADFWAGTYEYNQSHRPVREQTKVVGHAVRAMYMYSAMADLSLELADDSLKRACETLWKDVIETKMYITSGLGPAEANEGFTEDFDLPNSTAYAETCASVALIFWAQRMLHFDLDGRYADVLERALFNGALTGLSRDGEHYFYSNPLESTGGHSRWAWHFCPCCTMNASRLVASVGGYFLSQGPNSIVFHLYGGLSATLELECGPVKVSEVSTYPWDGAIDITVEPAGPATFDLVLRIPGWCENAFVAVNGTPTPVAPVKGYVTLRREWRKGDRVQLTLSMPATRAFAHPSVNADIGRVALTRGPLVYCVEEIDNPGGPVQTLRLPRRAGLVVGKRQDVFGEVVIHADAVRLHSDDWAGTLYRQEPPKTQPVHLTAIPYFLWNNRGSGSMNVWIPEV
jgi:DUF1680 family protein